MSKNDQDYVLMFCSRRHVSSFFFFFILWKISKWYISVVNFSQSRAHIWSAIRIVNITEEDFANYTCQMLNTVGSAFRTISLVEGEDIGELQYLIDMLLNTPFTNTGHYGVVVRSASLSTHEQNKTSFNFFTMSERISWYKWIIKTWNIAVFSPENHCKMNISTFN